MKQVEKIMVFAFFQGHPSLAGLFETEEEVRRFVEKHPLYGKAPLFSMRIIQYEDVKGGKAF